MNQNGRFTAIDGLRGIAALAVVIYHMAAGQEWGVVQPIVSRGFLGVEIFFVISGFVIAHSVAGREHTPRFLGRFALRRILRLDPPYWLVIALELVLIGVTIRLMPGFAPDVPTIRQTLSHLIYAQNLTGDGDILPIFWTLCFEVQFYLFFVGSLVLWRAVRGKPQVAAWLLAGLYVFSAFARYGPLVPDVQGLAHERWHQFFLGVLTYWCVSRRAHFAWLYAAWALLLALVGTPWAPAEALIVVVVSMFVALLGVTSRLGTALNGRVLQYLGRQSYSLYLIHLPIGGRVAAVVAIVLPLQWVTLVAGTVASIVAADILWRVVERPSIAWSKRIRPVPDRSAVPIAVQNVSAV